MVSLRNFTLDDAAELQQKQYTNMSLEEVASLKAMMIAMETAKNNGYQLMSQQIRVKNTASIALHNKLGFETDGCIYKNRNGNDVQIFIKLL